MKERPIIFNDEMVRAVLEGRKTQTRRTVKSPLRDKDFGCELSGNELAGEVSAGNYRNCPFGALGDRLWVRETWQAIHDSLDEFGNVDERTWMPTIPKASDSYWHAVYAETFGQSNREDRGFPWRPSIHMPRWASRITLEITGVRVERLNSISEADAKAEGLAEITKDGSLFKFGIPDRDGYPGNDDKGWPWTEWERNPVDAYCKLWQSIYGEESWQANPWVWCISFRRVE